MQSEYLLVEWVLEKKFSIVKRSAIVDPEERKFLDETLIGTKILVAWKSKSYEADIIQCGDKTNLKHELEELLNQQSQAENPPLQENNIEAGNIRQVLQAVASQSLQASVPENEVYLAKIRELETKLQSENEKSAKFKNKYKTLKRKYKQMTETEVSMAEIGDGVYLPKGQLDTILAISDNSSKLARNLMRALYTDEELKNHTLFGRPCNANKDSPTRPSIDEKRRDAIISFTLTKFGGNQIILQTKNKARHPLLTAIHTTMGDYLRHTRRPDN